MRKITGRIYRVIRSKVRRNKYLSIFKKFQDYTMVSQETYISNLEICELYSAIPGAIVECGTWKGGMVAGIACLLGKDRAYFLFDSFEGLPEAKEIDGEAAIQWQSDKNSEFYYDNCKASKEDAKTAMEIADIRNTSIVKGWFNETLPEFDFKDGISILRMDADWYDSTTEILNNLFEKVNKGGIIIIDDYYTWDGCSKAIHDYLSRNKCIERISANGEVAYIVKR